MQQNQGKIIFKKKYSDKFLWLSEEIMLPLLQSVSGIWQQKTQNKPCQSALCATDCGSLNGLGKMEGVFLFPLCCYYSDFCMLVHFLQGSYAKGKLMWSGQQEQNNYNDGTENGSAIYS